MAAPAHRARNEYLVSERRLRIAFLAPALVVIVAVLALPLVYAVRNSFYRINLARAYEGERFIGFGNYRQAFSDPYFINALLISLIITVAVVALELVIGLFLALLLNRPLERRLAPGGRKTFRTLAILPVVLPPVVVGLMWRFIFQYTGLVNYLLMVLGFHPVAWTAFCADQMTSLEKNFDTLASLNTIAVGISVDSVPCKKAWAGHLGIENTRLLCDFWPHGKVAQIYGLFREANGFSERANVIVDEAMRIMFVKVYPVHSVPDIDEVISFIRTL